MKPEKVAPSRACAYWSPKTPLHHALECAAHGWAVFPVNLDKTPRTPNGLKAASAKPERIRAMAAQFGFVLIGIRTGEASNLAVLDIDRQHNGAEWWQGNRHRLPGTRTHRTRSGGLHLLFQNRDGIKNSAGKIAPGVDTRGENGYIVYWPATGLEVLSDAPLAEWPAWLIPPPKPAVAPSHAAAGPRPAAHVESALAGLIRTIALAPPGQRNDRLFWAASRAAELVGNGELSEPHAIAVLAEAASRAGLDQIEAGRTIASAFTRRAA